MSTTNTAFSALFLLLSLSCFSQNYIEYEFIKGREYLLQRNKNGSLLGTFIESDSTGMFIKTATNPKARVPFYMIATIETQRAYLEIEFNNESQKGYLRSISYDEIALDTKEGKSSIKLEEINRILVKGKRGVVGRSVGIGALTMGALGIYIGKVFEYGVHTKKAAGLLALVGAGGGLIVGAVRSAPKKKYSDLQMFLNEFEPWLNGESTIPKRYTRMVKITF